MSQVIPSYQLVLAESQCQLEDEQPPCTPRKQQSDISCGSTFEEENQLVGTIRSLIESDHHIRSLYFKDKASRLQKDFLINNQVNSRMRTRLVKWLNSLSISLEFRTDTFFMAVTLLDRYLSVCIETPKELQLVGASCLYIASKLCESVLKSPEVYAYSSAGVFTAEDLLQKEKNVLTKLNFKTDFPDVVRFLKLLKTKKRVSEHQFRECLEVLTFLSENDTYYYEYSSLELAELVLRLVKSSPEQLRQALTYQFLDSQFRKFTL